MIKMYLILLISQVALVASSGSNYAINVSAQSARQGGCVTVYGVKICTYTLTNYINDDVVNDALEQYYKGKDSVLQAGSKKVFDAIESLLPELKRLEEAYRKMNIVTTRLDKIRQLNTQSVFASAHEIAKASKQEVEEIKFRVLSAEQKLFLLEAGLYSSELKDKYGDF